MAARSCVDAVLAKELQSMRTIRHLISPNEFHYAYIGEWARAFQKAATWDSPGVRERARSRRIEAHFTKDLSPHPPEEWRDGIDQTVVPVGIFGEYVFSKTAPTWPGWLAETEIFAALCTTGESLSGFGGSRKARSQWEGFGVRLTLARVDT